ncbi:uncharacterized protein LOC123657160 [Melitaea cinxia]|uniref:uncharacterized protein LOC123657160 n=1 Tax=Melitaea cinxia TaxID=113334 RepID=UPI001E274058|nr:uncharacterized protein LOC123657160 [Melitaea cinxia]
MTRGKSPSHDSLSIEHLQHAGSRLAEVMAFLFNLCIVHSYLPPNLMKTVVVPIVKNKTGDSANSSNYRPISLATIITKVLDSVLNAQLDCYLHIHELKFGFRSQLSTESAILSLKHAVSNQLNTIKWANEYSEPYRLECGVRQGGLSSPNLLNLYVNALIEGLSSMRVGCHIGDVCFNNISYADEMVLLAPSVSAIRRMLAFCESYAETHGLVYNNKKSEYLVFKAGNRLPENIPLIKLNGACLVRVHQFKYLGHIVTEDLKDNVDIERERRALSIRANMLARRFARCSTPVKITSYNALRVQYNNAFRALLGLPRYCSTSSMFAHAGVDSFPAILP